jgi:hypothetical protein
VLPFGGLVSVGVPGTGSAGGVPKQMSQVARFPTSAAAQS